MPQPAQGKIHAAAAVLRWALGAPCASTHCTVMPAPWAWAAFLRARSGRQAAPVRGLWGLASYSAPPKFFSLPALKEATQACTTQESFTSLLNDVRVSYKAGLRLDNDATALLGAAAQRLASASQAYECLTMAAASGATNLTCLSSVAAQRAETLQDLHRVHACLSTAGGEAPQPLHAALPDLAALALSVDNAAGAAAVAAAMREEDQHRVARVVQDTVASTIALATAPGVPPTEREDLWRALPREALGALCSHAATTRALGHVGGRQHPPASLSSGDLLSQADSAPPPAATSTPPLACGMPGAEQGGVSGAYAAAFASACATCPCGRQHPEQHAELVLDMWRRRHGPPPSTTALSAVVATCLRASVPQQRHPGPPSALKAAVSVADDGATAGLPLHPDVATRLAAALTAHRGSNLARRILATQATLRGGGLHPTEAACLLKPAAVAGPGAPRAVAALLRSVTLQGDLRTLRPTPTRGVAPLPSAALTILTRPQPHSREEAQAAHARLTRQVEAFAALAGQAPDHPATDACVRVVLASLTAPCSVHRLDWYAAADLVRRVGCVQHAGGVAASLARDVAHPDAAARTAMACLPPSQGVEAAPTSTPATRPALTTGALEALVAASELCGRGAAADTAAALGAAAAGMVPGLDSPGHAAALVQAASNIADHPCTAAAGALALQRGWALPGHTCAALATAHIHLGHIQAAAAWYWQAASDSEVQLDTLMSIASAFILHCLRHAQRHGRPADLYVPQAAAHDAYLACTLPFHQYKLQGKGAWWSRAALQRHAHVLYLGSDRSGEVSPFAEPATPPSHEWPPVHPAAHAEEVAPSTALSWAQHMLVDSGARGAGRPASAGHTVPPATIQAWTLAALRFAEAARHTDLALHLTSMLRHLHKLPLDASLAEAVACAVTATPVDPDLPVDVAPLLLVQPAERGSWQPHGGADAGDSRAAHWARCVLGVEQLLDAEVACWTPATYAAFLSFAAARRYGGMASRLLLRRFAQIERDPGSLCQAVGQEG